MRLSRLALTPLLLCLACAVDPEPETADNQQVTNRGAGKDNWWDKLPRAEWSAFQKIEQDQDWFEVYLVAADVYAIYEPGQFEEVISFLILGGEKALLLDTGLGIGDMRRVVEDLTDLEVIVVNSHTHYDHIGGNHQFDTIYGRDTEYTTRRSLGSSPEAVAGFLREGWVWKELPEGFVAAEFRSRPFTISRIINDGDVIDIGGRQLEILETPGHAPDSLCLLDRDNRMLFTGDTFYLAPLYTHLEGSDFDDYLASTARLAALSDHVESLLPAHNVPTAGSHYLVALKEAFEAIADGTATDYTETDGLREYQFDGFSVLVRP